MKIKSLKKKRKSLSVLIVILKLIHTLSFLTTSTQTTWKIMMRMVNLVLTLKTDLSLKGTQVILITSYW